MDRSEYDAVHEGCYDIEEKLKARVKRLEEVGRNLQLCHLRGLPTPYGHDCNWCVSCSRRARSESEAALVEGAEDAE